MGLTLAIVLGSFALSAALAIPVLRSAGVLGPRKKVLANGVPGTATLLGVSPTGTVINDINLVCKFQLRVEISGRPVYDVETKETVPMTNMALLIPGSTLAVRVDPEDPAKVFVDWQQGIRHPNLPTAPGAMAGAVPSAGEIAAALHDPSAIASTTKGSAADLLRTGQPARGMLKSFADTGQTVRATGRTSPVEILDDPLYVLTVELNFGAGMAPIEGTVVHRVPRALVPNLRLGMELRCAVDAGNPTRNFAVNWDAVPSPVPSSVPVSRPSSLTF
jgi:hypothetical protein